jgi:hypothetical protein
MSALLPPRPRKLLGLASAGLGLAPLLLPRQVLRVTGVDDVPENRTMARAVGVRELVVAAGLLRGRRPRLWTWARVAQDAVDLGVVGYAMEGKAGTQRGRLLRTARLLAGIGAVDLAAAVVAPRRRRTGRVIMTARERVERRPFVPA